MKQSSHTPVGLLVAGSLFLIVGLVFAVGISFIAGNDIARIKRLEPSSVAALSDGAPGREVLLEGRISATMPAQFRDYVAFIHEVDVDQRVGKEDWDEVERVTPPLTIELPDGNVRVENSDYNFGISAPVTEGNDKYTGYRAGDPVIVLGVLRSNDDGAQITADIVGEGTVESYMQRARIFQWVFIGMGSVFTLIGIGLLAVALRSRRLRALPLPTTRATLGSRN